ncbi:MAG: helical backbone metal receptor [Nitriliruptoraceae bacterium]
MSEARTLVDDLGARVPLAGPPRRLVSLVPNLSELLAHVGLGDRLVAVTEYCVLPADGFPSARRVRGTKNPDVAAIAALAPDLVLANEEENRALDVERLRAAGIAVHVTRVRSLADLPASLARLAEVLDVTERVAGLLAELRSLPPAPRATGPRVACAVWRDDPRRGGDEEGWWLLGRDTYGASVIAAAGGALVPDDPTGRYPRAPLGELRALAPAVVLLPDEPYAFGAVDVAELAAVGLVGVPVDGRALWWWGHRTPSAVRALTSMLAAVAAGQ